MEMAYQIPRASLIWVLLSVVLAIAPQSARLPIWVSAIALICILWRVLIFLGLLDYPGKSVRIAVVLLILVLTLTQLQSLDIGLEAASTLLALGFVFKLIEMRNKRDIYVVLCLCFVMALVSFIFSQSALTTIYLTLVIMVVTATMVSLNTTSRYYRAATTLRLAVRITAQSLPLMIVLFVLFPRIAPLWGVPMQSNAGTTGVSDAMSPGDLSNLGRSGELAFRVTFENGPPPLHENLYWRGMVLDYFDGTTWRRQGTSRLEGLYAATNAAPSFASRASTSGDAIEYNIIMEPTQQRWLYGLHLAEPASPGVLQGRNFELANDSIIDQRISYDLRSYRTYQTDLNLPDSTRLRSLALPEGGNPLSRELARSLRDGVSSDRDYVFTVLSLFQQQPFYYTLNPPLLGSERIDDFLFNTREGFCEHFASAFVFMMRAAGVPSRVVVGYQGAEFNRFENYAMVYQYNAHAWTEVWLPGEGWVRFDPTAIVSPERIRDGVEAALQNDPSFMSESLRSLAQLRNSNWFNALRMRMDYLEYEWSRTVISYGKDKQFELFDVLFGQVTSQKVIILMIVGGAFALLIMALSIFRFRRTKPEHATERLYRQFCKDLAAVGLKRSHGEGPSDYCIRLCRQYPQLSNELEQITRLFVQLNYANAKAEKKELRAQLGSFKKSMAGLRSKLVPLRKQTMNS